MTNPVVIGIIGCGNISTQYLLGAQRSELVRVNAIADINPAAAAAQAAKFDVPCLSVEELLADPDIQIVINLTVPAAHAPVDKQILAAGKHVYGEKPLAAKFSDALAVLDLAKARGLRVGCAPDTFLGGAHQACRRAVDNDLIGQVIGGAATIMHRGMEHWHPNPAFFFQPGGGPVLDLGVYYVTALVNLLGPVRRVTASATIGIPTRTIATGPLSGGTIEVAVPTMVNGVLDFVSGANISLSASWEVFKHNRPPIELYGTKGSMKIPDPNFFGGTPQFTQGRSDWLDLSIDEFAFQRPNFTMDDGQQVADYRIIGLLDMATAIRQNRPHRASAELALHVLEILEAFEASSISGKHIAIDTRCTRPVPLPLGADENIFAQP